MACSARSFFLSSGCVGLTLGSVVDLSKAEMSLKVLGSASGFGSLRLLAL